MMNSIWAAIGVALLSTSAVGALDRQITESRLAANLERLELSTGNGSVAITPSRDDSVHVRLTLSARRGVQEGNKGLMGWFFGSRLDQQELVESVELSIREAGGRLTILPLPRGSSREDRINEHWVVEVPARFSVDLAASSSEVEVSGIEGGVRLRQGHGKASVDVPAGDLDLVLQVGDVRATSGARYSEVDVRSTVGDTKVWLDDRRVKAGKPPGPGSFFKLEGKGGDRVEIRVEVGNVALRLPQ